MKTKRKTEAVAVTKRQIAAVVRELFTTMDIDGKSVHGDRLVIRLDGVSRPLVGWSELGARNFIWKQLTKPKRGNR